MLEEIREMVELRADFVDEGTTIVSFSCRINENGVANSISQSIRDQEAFQEKRQEIRQAQREFEDHVWEVEDRLAESD